ncbi:phage tail protein [Rhodoplanes roseus]|uniref:Phage tail protein n=1 Tax=Rhodoplanes roseus TaxID=29409 RepID=A0A327KHC1_9BRAD|nr:tail fiber protein [Rhodoplanes roseus]RAI37531.1 phage tail protein [Rhodoplanes roseus]
MSDPFIGEIRLFGFPRVPEGWLACDGSAVPISQYDALYAVIGTTYGGDGISVFNVPNLCGRVPLSQGTGRGLTPRVLGEIGGAEQHSLIDQEMPSHSHALLSTTNAGTTATPGPQVHLAAASIASAKLYAPQADVPSYDVMAPSVGRAGDGLPHDNMMPTLTCSYCICWSGVFPSPG